VLPQLEQQQLFATIQLSLPIEDPANASVRVAQVKTFLCPSDQPQPTWTAVQRDNAGNVTGTICDVASANYVGMFGITEPGVDGEGIVSRNSQLSIRDVPDGTSLTLMVGERSHDLCQATWVGAVTGAKLFPPPGSPAPPLVENSSGMVLGHAGDNAGPG